MKKTPKPKKKEDDTKSKPKKKEDDTKSKTKKKVDDTKSNAEKKVDDTKSNAEKKVDDTKSNAVKTEHHANANPKKKEADAKSTHNKHITKREKIQDKTKKWGLWVYDHKLRVVFFLSVGFAIGASAYYYFLALKPLGHPITEKSSNAAKRFLWTCAFIGVLGLAGIIIFVFNVTNMFIGIMYIFLLTATLYYCVSTLSTSYYSLKDDRFEEIKDHTRNFYKEFRYLPHFIDRIQQEGDCCGFGITFTNSWPKLFGTQDLPDSCCVIQRKGCGTGFNPRISSGYLFSFEMTYFNDQKDKKKDKIFQEMDTACAEKIFTDAGEAKQFTDAKAKHFVGVPDEILRRIDEHFFRRKKPQTFCPVWKYNEDADILVYVSRGLEELLRAPGHIHNKSCQLRDSEDMTSEENKLYELHGGDDEATSQFVGQTKDQMQFVMYMSIVNCVLAILMVVVFWYYYSRLKARQMSAEQPPRDFQELDIEAAVFEGETKLETDDFELEEEETHLKANPNGKYNKPKTKDTKSHKTRHHKPHKADPSRRHRPHHGKTVKLKLPKEHGRKHRSPHQN